MRSSNKVQEMRARLLPSACFFPAVTKQTLLKSVIGCRHQMQMLKLHMNLSHGIDKREKPARNINFHSRLKRLTNVTLLPLYTPEPIE